MSVSRTRLLAPIAVLLAAAVLGAAASSAEAQFGVPLTLGVGSTAVDVKAGGTASSPVLGQVSILMSDNTALTEAPSPLVVYKRPSGCIPAPAATPDGRLPHNLYNETNVPVQTYVDSNCTLPTPVTISANQGSHFDYVFGSFQAVAPIATNTAVAGQNVSVGVAPATAIVPPVAIYVIEKTPMVNFDPPPDGCQSITPIIPGFAPHSMLNNGTGTLRIYQLPSCIGAPTEVAPGYAAHLNGSLSWQYAPAGTASTPATRAATRTRAACLRAATRKHTTRAATRKRTTRAATRKRTTRAASRTRAARAAAKCQPAKRNTVRAKHHR